MSPQRERIYERDGYRCVECGTQEDLTLDHRIPKSRGGSNADDNLQTMCALCNQAKADSMPAELVGSV
jgi:5-methylcytosine-specific restriction endonuclease McrA